MNHIDRVLCAFEHEEPDKVPKGGWFIDPALLVKLIGKSSGDQFIDLLHVWEMFNMDIKATKGGYEIEEVIGEDEEGRKIFRDYWRCVYKESGVGLLTPGLLESPIKDIDEVYDYEFPSFDEFKTDEIKKWPEITDYFIFAVVSGGFEKLTSQMFLLCIMRLRNTVSTKRWLLTQIKRALHFSKLLTSKNLKRSPIL